MSLLVPKRSPKAGIDIVPLIDVLTVLIFFFLMTMQFRQENILNITPPKVETAGPNRLVNEILVGVDPKGQYFYNDSLVTEEELNAALSLSAQADSSQPVRLLVDEDTPLKYMTYAMDASRKAGLEKVRLQTR